VSRGDTVVIVEAMKMENEVKAERDGVILAVGVKAGDRILGGQPLFDLGISGGGGGES
jgi:propionyl-CoA carboxylase alpha chain